EPARGFPLLEQLLGEFCWRDADVDRSNFVGFLLTIFFAHQFPGTHPMIVLNANQRGLGKSILMQIIAAVRDGGPCETVPYTPNDEEFETQLGARVRNGASVLVIDNVKGRNGRAIEVDSAVLERCITDRLLSFRLLGHSTTIKTPNHLLFGLTANHAQLSTD